jgi:hypothetical protein
MSTRITAAEAATLGIESTSRYDLMFSRIIEAGAAFVPSDPATLRRGRDLSKQSAFLRAGRRARLETQHHHPQKGRDLRPAGRVQVNRPFRVLGKVPTTASLHGTRKRGCYPDPVSGPKQEPSMNQQFGVRPDALPDSARPATARLILQYLDQCHGMR